MAGKNIIARVAFGIAIGAFLFSAVTLIRMIVIGSGMLWFGIIQVVGTILILGICFILLRVIGEDREIEEEIEDMEDEADKGFVLSAEIPSENDTDTGIDPGYDLSQFE